MRITKQIFFNGVSVLLAFSFIIGSLFTRAGAQATPGGATPFSGVIGIPIQICCNGILFPLVPGQFDTYSPAAKSGNYLYMMEWQNMIPEPLKEPTGIGLYMWWMIVPTERVLGDAFPGGKCIIPPECVEELPLIPPPWNVNKMGTTLE